MRAAGGWGAPAHPGAAAGQLRCLVRQRFLVGKPREKLERIHEVRGEENPVCGDKNRRDAPGSAPVDRLPEQEDAKSTERERDEGTRYPNEGVVKRHAQVFGVVYVWPRPVPKVNARS